MIKNDLVIKDDILSQIMNDLLLAMTFYGQERNKKLDDVRYDVLNCKNRILLGVILSSLENHTKVIMNFTNKNISDFIEEKFPIEHKEITIEFIFDVICEFLDFIKKNSTHMMVGTDNGLARTKRLL